jgi:intein-encoded DNA endonuclease-like protein
MPTDPQFSPDLCQTKDSESFAPYRSVLGERKGTKQLPLDTRTILFALVRELRAPRLSFGQLQRNLFEKTQICLSKATISGWAQGAHDPLGRVNKFDAEPLPELAYVIGVVLGDGNLNVHEYHDEILLSVTDGDFPREFSRWLEGPTQIQTLQGTLE